MLGMSFNTLTDEMMLACFDGVMCRLKNPEVEPSTGHSRHYYYGPPYYTSKYGYKVGMAVNISRAYGRFSVYFLMYKGEYDSLLPWPVRFTVNLTVAAPCKSKRQILWPS